MNRIRGSNFKNELQQLLVNINNLIIDLLGLSIQGTFLDVIK